MLHGWTENYVDPECPLECSACPRNFPESDPERYYTPSWHDDSDSLAKEFRKTFGVDPHEDLLICKECLGIGVCLEPGEWLKKWQAEEQGILSRQECLDLLEEE